MLGPEGEGLYSLFKANTNFLLLFIGFQVPTALTYYIANKKIDDRTLISIGFYWALLNILLSALVIGLDWKVDSVKFFFLDGYKTSIYLVLLSTYLSVRFFKQILAGILKGKKEFKSFNISELSINLFFLAGLALFFFNLIDRSSFSFENAILLLVIANIIGLAVYVWVYYRKVAIVPQVISSGIKTNLNTVIKYSWLGIVAMIINFLNLRVDVWFVQYYQGLEQLGYYSVATKFAELGIIFTSSIGTVMLPNIAENPENKGLFKLLSKVNATFFILLSLFVFCFSQYIVVTLYGVQFEEAVAPLRVLQIGVFFISMRIFFSMFNSAMNWLTLNIITSLIGLVFTIGLGLILIPKYGIMGASIASVISYFASFLYVYIVVAKRLDIGYNFFIPNKSEIYSFIKIISNKL